MKRNYLSTEPRLFLIKFRADSARYIFDYSNEILGDLIKEKNRYGIEYIKEFNNAKDSFKTLSKARIIATFDHDTHTIQELIKANYIKQ